MELFHHGCGIVEFPDAFVQNKKYVDDAIGEICSKSNYVKPNDGELKNSTITKYPKKFQNFQQYDISKKTAEIIDILDSSLIQSVLNYCKIFPSASWNVTWKTPGVLVDYSINQSMPEHDDNTIGRDYSSNKIINQYSAFNSITGVVILNESYDGGEIIFPSWGISISPRIGTVVMYPSSYIGFHGINEIKSGRRLAYLSWFGQGENGSQDYDKYIDIQKDIESIRKNFPKQAKVFVGKYSDDNGWENKN